ncbi:MAG: diguanylate cyclase, partial [Acidobacteriota bacterium]|nr:diguanylate cyclase [Acidobacteriota bacterium]
SLSHDDIRAIHEDGQGRLWVATNGGGLDMFDRQTGEFTHYRHQPGVPSALSSDRVRTVHEDLEGNLWIGTYDAGLNLLDPETMVFEHFRADDGDPRSLSDDRVTAILQDVDGRLWIGTDKGLNEWDPIERGFHTYQKDLADPSTLVDDRILTLFQDRGGVIWVGNRGGVNKWNPTTGSFTSYQVDRANPGSSLPSNLIQGFAESADGRQLWVATYGGLSRIDRRDGETSTYRVDPDDPTALADERVFSLLVDSESTLWVGTFEGGLHRLNADGRTFTRFQHDPSDPTSLGSNSVASIFEDSQGVLWLGAFRGGLNRFDPDTGTFIHYKHDPDSNTSLSSDRVVALFEDSMGALWVGTDGGGLNRMDPRTATFTHYRHDPDDDKSISSDKIYSIHEDQSSTLWVGTSGGISAWSRDSRKEHMPLFENYREEDGLANDQVWGILEDSSGYLWLSTNRGVSRLDPRTGAFRNIDTTHGLQSLELNFGAAFRSTTGEMFFGGNQGFSAFYPSEVRVNNHQPPVALTSVQKLNRDLETGSAVAELSSIELSYQDYVVSFEFAALDYTAPEKNRYAYMLEGFDTNWNELGNLNRATYTNLDPGNYVFRVRGANNDGVWGQQELALDVRVIPPWWQTWWAYLLYSLAGVGLILRYLARQQRRHVFAEQQRLSLADEVRSRTSELAERNSELERAINQLELASVTDSLTGLRNRRFLVNTIERDLALVHRMRREQVDKGDEGGAPTDSLFLIFDLDGFKEVNDSFGHSAGDSVLLQVTTLLEAACRKSDDIIRWGGDEFLIVARQADREAAEQLAERMRQSVEEHVFDLGHDQTTKLTCSIGFAFYPFISSDPELFSWEQVNTIADRALYIAKKSGRNAWVGVYETSATRFVDRRALLRLINENIEELLTEGQLELRTSIESHDRLVWAWA